MSNRQDEELKDIVAKLQDLKLQERVRIRRLNRLSEAGIRTTGTHVRVSEFSIGDKVKILNPGPLQAKRGSIVRIGVGTNRITVLAEDGTKIVRASSNLQHG